MQSAKRLTFNKLGAIRSLLICPIQGHMYNHFYFVHVTGAELTVKAVTIQPKHLI